MPRRRRHYCGGQQERDAERLQEGDQQSHGAPPISDRLPQWQAAADHVCAPEPKMPGEALSEPPDDPAAPGLNDIIFSQTDSALVTSPPEGRDPGEEASVAIGRGRASRMRKVEDDTGQSRRRLKVRPHGWELNVHATACSSSTALHDRPREPAVSRPHQNPAGGSARRRDLGSIPGLPL